MHPAACNGLECDPICGGHCWDEGVPGCQRCPAGQVLTAGECLLPEDIPNGFYRDDWLARPCRESCASCDGPNDDSCLSCSGTRYLLALPGSSGSCVTNCGQGFYSGSGNVCRRCHVSVRQICRGVLVSRRSDQVAKVDETLSTSGGAAESGRGQPSIPRTTPGSHCPTLFLITPVHPVLWAQQ